MKKTDWTGSWFWAVLITVGLGWHGVCLADEKTATDKRMFTQYLVSEAPVSGYDEEEREQVIAAAFKQLITKQLIAKVGKEADTQSFCAQVAAQNPMLYVERYGYMTRYKLPTKSRVGSKTVGHISSETESALIENDADANLHLRIRWNMQAVNQLLQELTTEGAALSQNSDKSRLNSSPSLVGDATNGDLSKKEGGEISSTAKADTQNSQLGDIETAVKLTSVEDVRRPLVLLWLNCRDEGGHYRLVEDRLVDEDIALVEFLRRGAKHKGIELLFPVLGEREREETSNIDWINASNRQAVLRASKRYATDLILIGNVAGRSRTIRVTEFWLTVTFVLVIFDTSFFATKTTFGWLRPTMFNISPENNTMIAHNNVMFAIPTRFIPQIHAHIRLHPRQIARNGTQIAFHTRAQNDGVLRLLLVLRARERDADLRFMRHAANFIFSALNMLLSLFVLFQYRLLS